MSRKMCVPTFLGLLVITSGFPVTGGRGSAQEPESRPRKVSPPATSTSKPSPESTSRSQKPATAAPATVPELLEQGKAHYRAARFKQALTKFEAALKVEPTHDETLALAAITAFRLDNQEQARQWFIRRAELPGQKPSVIAFSYYRVALTYWRRLHDPVAKSYTVKDGKITFKLVEADAPLIREGLTAGLDYAQRALRVNGNYAEAHNIMNLLFSEQALAASSSDERRKSRALALDSLRKAIRLQSRQVNPSDAEAGNFNLATVRIGEIARAREEEALFADEMMKLIEGGLPVKRVQPSFPSARAATPKTSQDASSATGVTDKGGAYSIGSGRGALTAAYEAGTVKVEVLVSTTGDVVFAHVVDGRADLNGAAILAARAWKFAPAKFEGMPVQLSGIISFEMKPGAKSKPTPRPAKKAQ